MGKSTQHNLSPKIKIVAVAKDEAAYLPEWVFHHMYAGFDAIDIYVNRTTDNTYSMIEAIRQVYPSVNAFDANWIDQGTEHQKKHMQAVIYQKAFDEIKKESLFDYVLFIDIDEYWFHQNINTKVQDAIRYLPNADCISFSWFNQNGDDDNFACLKQISSGKIHCLVKTMVKVTEKVKSIRLHKPELSDGTSVLVDGTPFLAGQGSDETLDKSLIAPREVMIVHRMFRSPMEYISLLNRGRPSAPGNIKFNRGGYNVSVGQRYKLSIDKSSFEKYRLNRGAFLSLPNIVSHLKVGQTFVTKRYEQTLINVSNTPPEQFKDLVRVFSGCDDKTIQLITSMILNSEFTKGTKNVEWLVELASHIEKQSKPAAYVLWKKALILRPRGPRILKKINQYKCEKVVDYPLLQK